MGTVVFHISGPARRINVLSQQWKGLIFTLFFRIVGVVVEFIWFARTIQNCNHGLLSLATTLRGVRAPWVAYCIVSLLLSSSINTRFHSDFLSWSLGLSASLR